MESSYKVSIILPIYNQEKYLDQSIPAVISQTYSNLEILAVNDGSIDGSMRILRGYAEKDERIKIIEKPNGGLVSATIAGIDHATGDYICFLDPDDYIGPNFVKNFMSEIGDCDIVATGYYRNDCGAIKPFLLRKSETINEDTIKSYRNELLVSVNGSRTIDRLFISRWNKMYTSSCVKKVAEKFRKCESLTLGEDTVFTYLALSNCKKVKLIRSANSYYYNVSNTASMMKSGDVEQHLEKSRIAYKIFSDIENEIDNNTVQAKALYYYLIETLFQRVLRNAGDEFPALYRRLKNDECYVDALKIIYDKNFNSSSIDIGLRLRLGAYPYRALVGVAKKGKSIAHKGKIKINGMKSFVNDIPKKGIKKATSLYKFRNDRMNAFSDVERYLPVLEERITPFLEKFKGKTTNFTDSSIENNVFVFWWDGFENAPALVKGCLASVKEHFPFHNIIEITKDTYSRYTDINEEIIRGYNEGRISVQTFSDILRFNLLKNNGGVWIDATIYFSEDFDLIRNLDNKSVESVCFSTTKNYLKYKACSCTWSGYFFASRKGSVLTRAMDYIFEQYYLKYETYSIYFFIDAALMICKINKIDGGALDRIQTNTHDMTLLAHILDEEVHPFYDDEIKALPQKLAWTYKPGKVSEKSYYAMITQKGERC